MSLSARDARPWRDGRFRIQLWRGARCVKLRDASQVGAAGGARADALALWGLRARDWPVTVIHDARERGVTAAGPEDEAWYWAAPILLDLRLDPAGTEQWLAQRSLPTLWTGGEQDEEEGSRWADHVAAAQQLAASPPALGRPPQTWPKYWRRWRSADREPAPFAP